MSTDEQWTEVPKAMLRVVAREKALEEIETQRLQRVCTIAQLAHEWAKARRARHTIPRVAFAECEHSTLDEYERERGQCFDNTLTPGHYALEEKLAAMCEPCRTATMAMLDKRRASAKLVGLSARLERACLGPRKKKGTL